ncbi:hypothetical protein [uncultured Gammaproteobacteria bacterium]|jgi:hypothetical protein|nr:hypothetical protein [uncultured Gammaproteobacteria bacterium]
MGETVFWLKLLYQLGLLCFFSFYFWIGEEVFKATDLMNNRLGKCLEYKAPFEVFAELTGKDYFLN